MALQENKPKNAYPLHWPVGYKRTKSRNESKFKQTPGDAQDFLWLELNRIGARNIVVSSNAAVRGNSRMYADAMGRHVDPGVAVYFNYNGNPTVLCCDTYVKVWENVYAIGKTIENLRAIDRYGVSDFLSRTFTGFPELPEAVQTPYKRPWYEVLSLPTGASVEVIRTRYRELIKKVHPDAGGSHAEFLEVQNAYSEAMKEKGYAGNG